MAGGSIQMVEVDYLLSNPFSVMSVEENFKLRVGAHRPVDI